MLRFDHLTFNHLTVPDYDPDHINYIVGLMTWILTEYPVRSLERLQVFLFSLKSDKNKISIYKQSEFICIYKTISLLRGYYIRPFSSKTESIKYNATLAITDFIRGTSREKLYQELGLYTES